MEKPFYIAAGLRKLGPFSKTEMQELYNQSKMASNDRIYDSVLKKWYVASEFLLKPSISMSSNLMDQILAAPVLAPKEEAKAAEVTATSAHGERKSNNTWYVEEGKFILGPYSYFSMISMILDLHISDKHLVKSSKDAPWKTLRQCFPKSETDLYQTALVTKTNHVPVKVNRRQNDRFFFDEIFSVNDGQNEFVVRGCDVSANSIAFFILETALTPGQVISCSLFLNSSELKVYTGRVLRLQQINPESPEIFLQKCVFLSTQELDLSEIDKNRLE